MTGTKGLALKDTDSDGLVEFIDVSSGCVGGGVMEEITIRSCLNHDINVVLVDQVITGDVDSNGKEKFTNL